MRADGTKADVDPPRLLLGGHRKQGGVIRLWPDEAVTTGLAIAEGIETALSLAHDYKPVWSVIDAGNLAAFPVLPGIETLIIGADHDEAGLKAAAACADRWAAAGVEVRRTAGESSARTGRTGEPHDDDLRRDVRRRTAHVQTARAAEQRHRHAVAAQARLRARRQAAGHHREFDDELIEGGIGRNAMAVIYGDSNRERRSWRSTWAPRSAGPSRGWANTTVRRARGVPRDRGRRVGSRRLRA